MQETGVRNTAYGADKSGLKGLAAMHWKEGDLESVWRELTTTPDAAILAEPFAYRRDLHLGEAAAILQAGLQPADQPDQTRREQERQRRLRDLERVADHRHVHLHHRAVVSRIRNASVR